MNCWRPVNKDQRNIFIGKIIGETTLIKLHTLFNTSNQISCICNQINK